MRIEIFTADPDACDELIRRVRRYADEGDEVEILDVRAAEVARRAEGLGVGSGPALFINGRRVQLEDE